MGTFGGEIVTNSKVIESLHSAALPTDESSGALRVIDPNDFLELQIIAQQISGDLDLEIVIGIPGQGSFFCFNPLRITLDPVHILEDPETAKFVAGHEGAHRRFSVSPNELLLPSEVEDLFRQPGFHATVNAIEDCAVNDGMSREAPGMARYTTITYEKSDKNGMYISTPEIEAIVQRLGREPKFARALAEIMRDWHRWRKEGGYKQALNRLAKEGRYASNLDPSVVKALRNTRRAAREAISQMPDIKERDEKVLKDLARERLHIIRDEIFPDIKILLEEDIDLEAMRKGLNNLDNESMSQNLSDTAKEEIKKGIEEFLKETAEELFQEFQDLNQKLNEEKEKQEELQEEIQNRAGSQESSESASESASGTAKEEQAESGTDSTSGGLGEPSVDDSNRELKASEMRERDLQNKIKQRFPELKGEASVSPTTKTEGAIQKLLQKLKDKLAQEGETPLPFDRLSRRTQSEIENAFEKLAEAAQEALREAARETLAEFEHEIVEALKPKLDEDPIETIHERRLREEEDEKRGEEFKTHLSELSRIQNELERDRKANLTPFNRVYEEVAHDVQAATNRLQRILIPRAFFQWEKDRIVGSRVNLARALQAEADPRYLTKLFEQRLNPTKRTHAFEILVDTSTSMSGEKISRTFEGVVFLASLCESLGVQFEVLEFSDSTVVRKEWGDSVKQSTVQDTIAQTSVVKGGTNDAHAISIARSRIQERDAMYKFIIVLTDAESGASAALQKILKQIESEEESVVVHFGIGPGTADTDHYYRHSYGNLEPKKFFEKFCDVIEEIILYPELFLTPNQKNNRSKGVEDEYCRI